MVMMLVLLLMVVVGVYSHMCHTDLFLSASLSLAGTRTHAISRTSPSRCVFLHNLMGS